MPFPAGDMDPVKFNPDRLMTPEGQRPGQLMPFGAGARWVQAGGAAGSSGSQAVRQCCTLLPEPHVTGCALENRTCPV